MIYYDVLIWKDYSKIRARYEESKVTTGECRTCGRRTTRSARTKILHRDCYCCRYLKMIYGPNIRVERL